MPRDRDDVEAALLNKGFKYKGGDHRYYFFEHQKQTTAIFTKVSHGSKYKSLDDSLISKMARQLKLNNKQFKNLVDCPFTEIDYINHLISLGLLKK